MSANLTDPNTNLAAIPLRTAKPTRFSSSLPFLLHSLFDSPAKITGNLWCAHSIFALD